MYDTNVRVRLLVTLLLALAGGCAPPAKGGPEGAFEKLRLAVVVGEPERLYDVLELETRWAVDTVYGYQREMADLVAKFPPEARGREAPRLALAAGAATPRAFFAAWARQTGSLASLGGDGPGLGVLARVERDGDGAARVVTTSGVIVPLARGSDGAWGYVGVKDELFRWRVQAANDLVRIRENAALYSPPNPSQ